MLHVPPARIVANDPDSASVRRVEPSRQQIGRVAYLEQDKPLPSRPSQATSGFHKKRVCCQVEEEKSLGNSVDHEMANSASKFTSATPIRAMADEGGSHSSPSHASE